MSVLVKRGGRHAYVCSGCGKEIAVKESHLRASGSPFKRYHLGCEIKTTDARDAQTTEATETVETPKETVPQSSVQARDKSGHFIKTT